ncbi:MAG: hypothetical protein IPM38_15290 [Ignavibacteria bacterium]|nr:hypothetical protein [Ignavibacteria bacterium]
MNKALKNTVCYTLILMLFFHINFVSVYYSLYLFNKSELTESVCEKKKVCCEAKCFIDKKINEGDTKSAHGTTNSNEIKVKISEFLVNGAAFVMTPLNAVDPLSISSQNISSGFPQQSEIPPRS